MNETNAENNPDDTALMGAAALLRMALSGADLAPVGARLIERANAQPDDANALMDLSLVLQLRGNRELALATQAQALQTQQLYSLAPAREAGLRLLALKAPGDLMANTPIECLLEQSDVALDMLYVSTELGIPASVPEHDALFVAVGESDDHQPLLQQLSHALAHWPRPVINRPEPIAHLSRDGACALFQSVPGMVLPASVRIDRDVLRAIGEGQRSLDSILASGAFPIILRPVGSHAGTGLSKLDRPQAIADYLQTHPAATFFVSPFVDYRSADGLFRKYRIALIEGRAYLSHLAISEHWMIHYANAGMADSAAKRAEEERCMANFDHDFARRHAQALQAIHERAGLEYLGIDCAETPSGELLIFEIDTSMVVHAMDPVDVYPYKQPQMRKLFEAFRVMLANAARA